MKLSMHNWMRPEPLETTVARLARFGYDAIEISGEPAVYEVRETRRILEKHAIRCSGSVSIMTHDRDLTHADKYIRLGTIEYLSDCIRMVHELGASMMCIVPAEVGRTAPHADARDQWGFAVEGLKRVADVARKEKVTIGLEPINRFETNFLNRCDQALALAKEIGDDVGVVLDAFHINIEEDDPIGAVRLAGKKLVDFHVADSNRRPPGQGHMDWRGIVSALKEVGYKGSLTAEFVNPVDRTKVARKPTAWSGTLTAEGASAAQLKFIQDHGSGVLSEAEYDKAVEETATFLKKLL